jgi:hypothetical protein
MALGRPARFGLVVLALGAAVVAGAVLVSETLFRQPLVEGCWARVDGLESSLSIEEAENAALIAAVSVRREMPARAATIALATAFQESGLRNIGYGHLDSLGLFQQRPSQGWGTPAQILDPYHSTARFYAALAKIDDYEQLGIADAAQLVQRSADGNAYAQHEPGARALASSLTGQSAAAFFCEVRPDEEAAARPDDLRTELRKAFGTRIGSTVAAAASDRGGGSSGTGTAAGGDPDGDPDGDVVDIRISRSGRTYGWSVAQWAVAYAKRFGVVSVAYGTRAWSADRSTEGWQADSDASYTRVRLVLASPA